MGSPLEIDVSAHRTPDHEVEGLFVRRWSPRAMSGEALTDGELARLLEAARWAPSSYNEQPWRFLYARRDTAHWGTFLGCLVEFNQSWAKGAGVLFAITASAVFAKNGKPNRVAVFDAGSAWQNLALQASEMGLVAHGMAGVEWDKAREVLNIPEDEHLCAFVAVGRPGRIEDLPGGLAEREVPSGRKPIGAISHEGPLGG